MSKTDTNQGFRNTDWGLIANRVKLSETPRGGLRMRCVRLAAQTLRRLCEDADAADQRTIRNFEEDQWPLRWEAAGHSESLAPTLRDSVDVSDSDGPLFRTLLFVMRPGTEFSDFAGDAQRLATCLGKDMITVERFAAQATAPSAAHLMALTVSHELRNLGPAAHLDSGLSLEASRFAARWAAVSAFVGAGLATPRLVGWELISEPGSPPVHATDWVLCDGLTTKTVEQSMDTLEELLGCGWADVRFSGTTVRLMFGTDPDDALLRLPLRSYYDIEARSLSDLPARFR